MMTLFIMSGLIVFKIFNVFLFDVFFFLHHLMPTEPAGYNLEWNLCNLCMQCAVKDAAKEVDEVEPRPH